MRAMPALPTPASVENATSPPGTYATIAGLPVQIDSCEFTPMVRDTSSGFTKITTVVRLRGRGEEGLGEDVTWDQIDHIEFLHHPAPSGLEGAWDFTLSFSGAPMGGGSRGMVMMVRRGDGGAAGGTDAASDPSGGLSLNDALTKQLGLKLETLKRPAPVVVIDRMDQKPIDN